jgi:hypothetical protein
LEVHLSQMDPFFFRRFERDAIVACLALAIAAAAWPGGGVAESTAVLSGGALAAVSYRGLKGVVDEGSSGGKTAFRALVKFFTRHAILASVAYVMLARLRIQPIGLIVGASSLVVAAGASALRAIASTSRSGDPR